MIKDFRVYIHSQLWAMFVILAVETGATDKCNGVDD